MLNVKQLLMHTSTSFVPYGMRKQIYICFIILIESKMAFNDIYSVCLQADGQGSPEL